jgi:hypothetical protein
MSYCAKCGHYHHTYKCNGQYFRPDAPNVDERALRLGDLVAVGRVAAGRVMPGILWRVVSGEIDCLAGVTASGSPCATLTSSPWSESACISQTGLALVVSCPVLRKVCVIFTMSPVLENTLLPIETTRSSRAQRAGGVTMCARKIGAIAERHKK